MQTVIDAGAEAPSAIVPAKELVELCAVDTELYNRTFFPQAFRQASPTFHRDMFAVLEDREHRRVGFEVFRDGGKTTVLRSYTSKRIAYGISRTILYVSEAQDHSIRSVVWLKKAIEHNSLWTQIFGLERGAKWTDELIEIYHRTLGITISVGAYGITGQVRGINVDDYRPDLIVVDDACDLENTATEDQRNKLWELFSGALEKSLSPASDAPDSKIVVLQTPLNGDDIINRCKRAPGWYVRTYGILDESNESRWPARHPTETVLREKQEHIESGQTLIWLREKECKLSNEATRAFRREWLQYWDTVPDAPLITYIGLDPVPPPSDRELAKDMKDKCNEAIVVLGLRAGKFFLLDYALNKGHTPEWTETTFFSFVARWNPIRARVESVNYQRTLKWFLEQAMRRRNKWVQINGVTDKRKKHHRIIQAFTRTAGNRALYVRPEHHEFHLEFESFPDVQDPALLDACAMAIDEALEFPVDADIDEATANEEEEKALIGWRKAP